MAFGGVAVAIARFAFVGIVSGVSSPLLLHEIIGTLLAIRARGVVLALATQNGVLRLRANVGVAIANASPAHRYLLDAVVVLQSKVFQNQIILLEGKRTTGIQN